MSSILPAQIALKRSLMGAALAALVVPAIVSAVAQPGEEVFHVTVTNETFAQGFSFPVAATHPIGTHLFEVGRTASAQAAAMAQNGTPVPLFNLLRSLLGNGVTDVYGDPFPISSAGAVTSPWPVPLPFFDATANTPDLTATALAHTLPRSISFTITAGRRDRFSLLMMLMCTNDGLAGLDSVTLPGGLGQVLEYPLYGYDAGAEPNSELSQDIVDPCGLMAPLVGGAVQVPLDGNINSAPQGLAIAPFTNPTITGAGNIPQNFGWDANARVGLVTIIKIN